MSGPDHSQTISLVSPGERAGVRAGAQLIVVLECHRPLASGSRHLLADVDVVELGRGGEREVTRAETGGRRVLSVRLADGAMSSPHARLLRVQGRWILEDQASKNGTVVNGYRVRRAVVNDGDLIELGRTLLMFRDAVPPIAGAGDLSAPAEPLPGLPTWVTAVGDALTALGRVAGAGLPVLVLGESGTGKELVARGVHARSGRGARPFVAVNCAALSDTLVESELFGHRRGSFSGALEDRPGLFRSADGGTLFLDEIGDLRPAAQAALLRALQEREILPVGETRPVKVDVRLVAATHRDLDARSARGEFRHDLLARLAGFTVTLAPLGERREDLGLLVGTLLGRHARAATLTPAAARALFSYAWPLNVRELEMALAAAAALAPEGAIDLPHLPAAVRAGLGDGGGSVREGEDDAPLSPAETELRSVLVEHLTAQRGNVSAVARAMGKGRQQIHRWLQRFGLDLASFRR